jgi:hypothetical protein
MTLLPALPNISQTVSSEETNTKKSRKRNEKILFEEKNELGVVGTMGEGVISIDSYSLTQQEKKKIQSFVRISGSVIHHQLLPFSRSFFFLMMC